MADIRCPMCGKPNPAERDVCQYCQARLKPLTAALPPEPPKKPSAEPPKKKASEPAPKHNADDWLGSLRDQDDESFGESGDWLDDETLIGAGEGERDPLAWLSSIDSGAAAPGKPAEPEPDETEWLANASLESPASPGDTGSFERTFTTSSIGRGRREDDVDLSEWLSSLDKDQDEGIQVTGGEEASDWLAEFDTAGAASDDREAEALEPPVIQSKPAEDDLPDWLAGLAGNYQSPEPGFAQRTTAQEAIEPTQPADLPAWLASLSAGSGADRSETDLPLDEFGDGDVPAEELPGAELPDWIDRLGEPAAPPAAGEPATAELPDWMASLGAAGDADEMDLSQPPSKEKEFETALLPDWLATLESGAGDDQIFEQPESSPEPDTASLPAWMAALGETEPTGSLAPEEGEELEGEPVTGQLSEPAETASEPEWFANFEQVEELDEPPAAARNLVDAPMPEWLASLSAAEAEASLGTPAEMPDWLQGLRPTQDDLGAGQLEGEAEGADWLSDLERGAGESEAAEVQDLERAASSPFAMDGDLDSDLESLYQADVPDWLQDVTTETPAETGAVETGESLERAELPGWLAAMRPVGSVSVPRPLQEEEEEYTEAGPLAGLRGILPAEPVVATSRPKALSLRLDLTDSQQKHINLLETLLASEEAPRPAQAPARLTPQHLLRWVIALCLLVAVGYPVVTGSTLAPLPLPPSGVLEVRQEIQALPAGAPVLVSFDYEARLAGEMEAVAGPVLDDLMLRGAPLVLISTTPSGAFLAEQFIQQVHADHQYTSGQQYLNLGYLPGSTAGLASFASQPQRSAGYSLSGYEAWGQVPLQGVASLADFGLVLIITDRAETAQAWIEQTGNSLGDTPLLVAASAQAEPLIRPYYQSGQVKGLVGGISGGSAYDNLLGVAGQARRYWDAYQLGLLLAVAVIILGAAANYIMAVLERNKRSKGERTHEPA